MLVIALVPLELLAVAGLLEPSQEGMGTHQQLGLPPCAMRVVLGVRCPGCGMTTSWSHLVGGQWLSSLQSNIGGFMLAGFSVIFAPVALGSCLSGKMPSLQTQKLATLAVLAIAAVTLTQWAIRVSLG